MECGRGDLVCALTANACSQRTYQTTPTAFHSHQSLQWCYQPQHASNACIHCTNETEPLGKATEGLENELWRRWSDWKLGEWAVLSVALPTSQLILQTFRRFTYVTAHYITLSSLYLSHGSFSNRSVASSTSQIILQHFFRFSYVTGFSLTSPGEPPILYCNTNNTRTRKQHIILPVFGRNLSAGINMNSLYWQTQHSNCDSIISRTCLA